MSAKFEAFKAEFIALCDKHGVYIPVRSHADPLRVLNVPADDNWLQREYSATQNLQDETDEP